MKTEYIITDKLSRKTDHLVEKYPYAVFIFILWLIFKASQGSKGAWTTNSFLTADAILIALYCFFFYVKILLSTIRRNQNRLYKRVGATMKVLWSGDFILTVIGTALLFWVELLYKQPVVKQIFFGVSLLAQLTFLHLFLATLYSFADRERDGLRYMLSASTVILLLALITLTPGNTAFATKYACGSPFIGLFYMYLIDIPFFIWGISIFTVLLIIGISLIANERYRKWKLLNSGVSGLKYLSNFDWVLVLIGLLGVIGLLIYDTTLTGRIVYAIIAVVLCIVLFLRIRPFLIKKKILRKRIKSTIKPIDPKKISKNL